MKFIFYEEKGFTKWGSKTQIIILTKHTE